MKPPRDPRGLLTALLDGGRFPLLFTGLILLLSGLFIIVQSALGYFLPHDVAYLGLTAEELSRYQAGRITWFMFHDRVAFGGSIMSVGCLYLWLVEFPLKRGEAWSWWVLFLSGLMGFGSFLTYLGYGYLDTWHGFATLLLLPFYATGLALSLRSLNGAASWRDLLVVENSAGFRTRHGIGVGLLQLTGLGILLSGLTIMFVGMTTVFVPQDLQYMGVRMCGQLTDINARLVPLIAHDRACFGGGLATTGLILWITVRRCAHHRSLWEILLLTLSVGFASALGVHFIIGYTDFTHLLPAYLGLLIYLLGLGLTYPAWKGSRPSVAT